MANLRGISGFASTQETATHAERPIRARLLSDKEHYDQLVTQAVAGATVAVWITTANLKTMLVEAPIGTRARARGRYISFFETLDDLAKRGVDICILHASRPSGPLAKELRHIKTIKMRKCPRVHMKMIAIDGRLLYLGSANLTGAGLGAKGEGRRNFEMGILTDNEAMLDTAQGRFDRIWRGVECKGCKLRSQCDAPIDMLGANNSNRSSGVRLRSASTRASTSASTSTTSRGSSTRTRRSLSVLR